MRVNSVTNLNYYNQFRCNKKQSNNSQINFCSNPSRLIYDKMRIEVSNMFYGHRPFGFHSPEGYYEVLKNFDVKNLLSMQGESAVFLMEDPNRILKISCTPYEAYIPELHAPELGRGVIITEKKYPIINFLKKVETDKFYWVMQRKGIMPVSQADQELLINKVKSLGYQLRDIKHDQFAYFDGEPKFIDLGCVYKNSDSDKHFNEMFFS